MLSQSSPRIDFRSASFADIDAALKDPGHVVLDNVWNTSFLDEIRQIASERFEQDDEKRNRGESLEDLNGYMGGELSIGVFRNGPEYNRRLFVEFERSGLPALMRYLFEGPFVLGQSGASARRVDPRFPVRFTGLHHDGQLKYCSSVGLNTNRELTLWTPLVDCTDDRKPRLLLLNKKYDIDDIFEDEEKIRSNGVEFLPVALNLDPIGAERAYKEKTGGSLDGLFARVFAEKECYAPYVAKGSIVLFDHRVVHGSYRTDHMTTPRYSFDMRLVGEFKTTWENCEFVGTVYRSETYPDHGLTYFAKKMAFRAKLMSEFVRLVPRAAYRKLVVRS